MSVRSIVPVKFGRKARIRPKLIVIVDTVPPKVQLTAVRGEAGQITAAFHIEEIYPKLDSLTIEYRLASTSAWQTVPVGPKDVRSNNAQHRGEVTWYPQNASGTMEIRLRVNDMAGNPAESHAHLDLPAAGRGSNGKSHEISVGIGRGTSGRNQPLGPARADDGCPSDGPSSIFFSNTNRLARSCGAGYRTVATAWPTDEQDVLAGGERQSGLHRRGQAGRVPE